MIRFTIKRKNKEEERKKEGESKNNNKGEINDKIKEAIKNLIPLQIMTNKYGNKFFLNINLNPDLSLKKQPQAIQFIKWHKTPVKLEAINKEIMKSLGGKMLRIRIKKSKVAQKMMKKRLS